jgi:hypothetical protein
MDNVIGFAAVAGAIIASMGLAMWLEWYCLRWVLRLMPGRPAGQALEAADSEAALEREAEEEAPRRAA